MFNISYNSKIVIYGLSLFRPNLIENMRNQGYNVISCFDMRAEELNGTLDFSVYTIENAPYSQIEKNEIVVLICLQNAVQHDKVSKQLYENGYDKILFLPTDENIKPEKAAVLRKEFQYFFHDQYDKIGDCPCYSELFYSQFDYNRCVECETLDRYTVWLPLDILYTEKEIVEYSNLNIASYEPYQNLINFLSDGIEDCSDYFQFSHKLKIIVLDRTHIIDNKFLKHRAELYHFFMKELNRGMDFFIQSAPPADWNEKGYFNLEDGHHRTVFLQSKGLTKFPVSIKKEDFNKFLNLEKLSCCLDFINKNNITQTLSPITHPALLYFPEKSNGVVYQILSAIGKFLSASELRDKSVIEISHYNSFFARYFKRSRATKVVSIETDTTLCEFAKHINELLYLKDIETFNTDFLELSQLGVEFDITIMLKSFCDYFDEKTNLQAIKQIDLIAKELLFWESGENIEQEKEFILTYTKFKHYKFLRKQFSGEFITELGVFSI